MAGHKNYIQSIEITSDNKHIVSRSRDRTIIWNIKEKTQEYMLEGYYHARTRVLIVQDTTNIIPGAYDDYVIVDKASEVMQDVIIQCITNPITALAISKDSKYIISSSENNLKILNLYEKNQKSILNFSESNVTSVAVSKDYRFIVFGSGRKQNYCCFADNHIRVWNFEEKQEIAVFRGHTRAVSCVVISNDNKYIISGSEDSTIVIWNLHEKRKETSFNENFEGVNGIAITSDNKYIVSASGGTLRIWNFRNRRKSNVLIKEDYCINNLLITPDDRFIAASFSDYTVKVWAIQTQQKKLVLGYCKDRIESLASTNNGKYIISGSLSRTFTVWRANL